MGIFGALTTSVAGMRAQSYALENISGNIANSQTTAFKRIDTSFLDLVPDTSPNRQLAGSVTANSRATNTVQGDIQSAQVTTFMAINGAGFFSVQKPTSFSDNSPVFGGVDMYTRRGDFQINKEGYLVNGSGYYLMGIPVDPSTGNVTGSVPQVLKFQNDFIPAQASSRVDYRANLSSLPLTPNYESSVPGSELLKAASFSSNPLLGAGTPAAITGAGASLSHDAAAVVTGATLPATLANPGAFTIGSTTITLAGGETPAQVVAAINAAAPAGVTASLVGGKLTLTSADADTGITIGGTDTALMAELGISVGVTNPTNLLTQNAVTSGQTMNISIGSNALAITFGTGAGQVSTLDELNAKLATIGGGTASVDLNTGNITITAANATDTVTVTGTASIAKFGIQNATAVPPKGVVIGNDVQTFIDQSINGGAVTVYDATGAPVNLQLRWAKTDSAASGSGHTDTWNLFYQVDGAATGTNTVWKNVGTSFTFGSNGQMSPAVSSITLTAPTINGTTLGDISLNFGAGGLTQFADSNGNVQVNQINQDGFAAGQLQSVSVSDSGRIVGSYSNGRTMQLAEVTLANFNAANALKRIDGGAFEVTDQSGPALYGNGGAILGSSLEASNTDIADEFTKLIVTQQAYSANTRVISTSNTMVQDLLNMLR